MTALVGRFKMQVSKVGSALERINSRLGLALKICIDIACCALNLRRFHTRAYSYALKQVNRAYNAARNAVFLLKVFKLRASALAPEPNGVCFVQAFFAALYVHGVIFKYFITLFHKVYKRRGVFALA